MAILDQIQAAINQGSTPEEINAAIGTVNQNTGSNYSWDPETNAISGGEAGGGNDPIDANIPPTPAAGTPNFSIPNFDYGDTGGEVTAPQQETGVGTSQGTQVTDLANINLDNVNLGSFSYGQDAIQQEEAAPGYLAPRNDILAAYFYANNMNDPQQIYNTLSENQSFQQATEEDKQNTVSAILLRIGQQPGGEQSDPIQESRDAIDQQYESQKNQILQEGAIEDRYTNFNEIDQQVQNVMQIAGQHRLDNQYDGMPTDQDIQDIANSAGIDFDRAKRILEGFGYEALEMQPEFEGEATRFYDRNIQDLETNASRQKQDLQRQLEETRQNIQRQQQDVLRQAENNINAMQAISALGGSKVNTTAFVRGINGIHEDAMRTVERLEIMLQQAESATDEMKGRLMQDYNKELGRAKEELDYQMRDFNSQMGMELSARLREYSGTELAAKLKSLNNDMLDAKIDVVNKYTDQLAKINEQKNKEIDAMVKYDNFLKTQQVDQYGNIIKNQGSVLAQMSVPQIIDQYEQGLLTIEQVKLLQQSMITRGELTLGAEATPEDKAKYANYLQQGYTPTQAIQATIQESGGRLKAPTSFTGEDPNAGGGGGSGGGGGNNSAILEQIKNRTITLGKARSALGFGGMHASKAQEEIAKLYLQEYASDGDPTSIANALAEFSVVMGDLDASQEISVVSQTFGSTPATQYVVNTYDVSDTDKIAQTMNNIYQAAGEAPQEEEVKETLKEAGVGANWNNFKINKIWKKMKK